MIGFGKILSSTQLDHQKNEESSTYPKEEHSQIPAGISQPTWILGIYCSYSRLSGGFKYSLFSPLPGEMIQLD